MDGTDAGHGAGEVPARDWGGEDEEEERGGEAELESEGEGEGRNGGSELPRGLVEEEGKAVATS